MSKKWWMEAVGYQIYPRSFNDSNGDGIGDIKGIIEKLDYLKDLGVNLLWLCPFYKSPMDDNGYDVSDYYDVDPEFGTIDDVKKLISDAHARGIRIIADLVLNHTSDEHPWFMEARKSTDNKYRDYYIWKKGRVDKDGNEIEPTNWASFFGGSAWRKDEETNEYFMKIFSNKMPDLNWENEEMRNEMYTMAKWWLDLGIDGFRVDAVAHLDRDRTFTDSTLKTEGKYAQDWGKFSNLPNVHKYLKEFNKEVLAKYDVMSVGEVGGGASPEEALKYAGFDSEEFNMVFNFDHNWCTTHKLIKNRNQREVDLLALKRVFNKWQNGLYGKGWNTLYWLNHDQPRAISQYGDTRPEYHNLSGKMLCTSMYFMWGTPFIYNGEEIGMTNIKMDSIEDYRDVSVINRYNEAISNGRNKEELLEDIYHTTRDNARTPMQWTSGEYAGFSTHQPWMKVNPNYKTINVEAQINDQDSLLNYYKKVNNLRTNSQYKDVIVYGAYKQLLEENPHIYAYLRTYNDKQILVITNFTDKHHKVKFNDLEVNNIVISNYYDSSKEISSLNLRPYEAIVYEVK